jgi:protein phosphatase
MPEVFVTHATQFRWTSAARTHVGMVREINEDSFLEQPARGLWAVADGMGGHARGDVASRMVVESLSSIAAPAELAQFVNEARACLQAVNRQLLAEAIIRDVSIIGSTAVVLLACDGVCTCLWAGDSRIYLHRNASLRLLTRDHSQVEELLARGALTAESALHYPAQNLITRAVGATDTLELDEETLEVEDGDMFLLCSDGLSNSVSEEDIGSALAPGSCKQAAEALIALALKGGGRDNISAVVVRADDQFSIEQTVLNPTI